MKIPVKFRRILRQAPGKPFVLKRIADGKFMSVVGWSVEWIDEPDATCPLFRDRCSQWHVDTLRSLVRDCTLTPCKHE